MAKYTCRGAAVEIDTGSGTPTWTVVDQVETVEMPQATTEELEGTTLDNTSGYREYLPSFKDGGEMTITVLFDPAMHVTPTTSIWALFQAGTTHPVRVNLPSNPAFNFEASGFVRDCGLQTIGPDELLKMQAVVRISGAADIVAAA
jgi:hypothetical protein